MNPHKFNNDLYVNIGHPINVADYDEEYSKDTYKGARSLTEAIRLNLEKLIININDEHTEQLISKIEKLYKKKLSKDLGISEHDKEADFKLTKNVVDRVNYYIQTNPDRAKKMNSRIDEYLNKLNQIGLSDFDLQQNQQNKSLISGSIKSFLTIVFGFPIFVYGLINNYLPFEIPGKIANKTIKRNEFKGAIVMVVGMLTFMVFYTTQIVLVWKFTNQVWISALYAISLPFTGFFAYWYFHTFEKIRAKWILMKVFYKKSMLISSLILEREQIISEFDKAKEESLNI